MSYYYFPKYVTVAEKRAKALQKLDKLKKKNPNLKPVRIDGQTIASTWWGKEWNSNLERYADYSNRIGRGRSYVRHGAVLHLDITPGKIDALVQGSQSAPYEVTISIKPIPKKNWEAIKAACKGKLGSLQTLIAGKFPKEMALLFTQKGDGLFPSPEEISFECSCPDWASMCKHVAAVLYGVGSRLDHDPDLFFVLRKVDKNDLISEAVTESKNDLLKKAARKSSRVLESDVALSDMFGIDLDDTPAETAPKSVAPLKKKAGKKATPPSEAPKKSKTPIKLRDPIKKIVAKNSRIVKQPQKTDRKEPLTPAEIMEQVEDKIRNGKADGVKISDIISETGLDTIKIRNAITRLKQLKKIESAGWGLYRVISTKKKKDLKVRKP